MCEDKKRPHKPVMGQEEIVPSTTTARPITTSTKSRMEGDPSVLPSHMLGADAAMAKPTRQEPSNLAQHNKPGRRQKPAAKAIAIVKATGEVNPKAPLSTSQRLWQPTSSAH